MGVRVSDSIELKVINAATFAQVIEEMVVEAKGAITHLEAIEEFLERNEEVEPETIAALIQRNQKLKAIIYENAEQLNLVEKVSKLPL